MNTPIRIGFDLCNLQDWNASDGVSAVTIHLAESLQSIASAEGVTVDCYVDAALARQAPPSWRCRVVPTLPLCRPQHRFVRYCLALELLRRPPSAFINHVHTPQPRAIPCPHIAIVHDLAFQKEEWGLYYTAELRSHLATNTSVAVRRANAFVAVSNCTRADLVALYGVKHSRVYVIYHGYDERRFTPCQVAEDEKVLGRLGPGPFVLSVGTLQPRKNYPLLIRAFARLRRRLRLPHRLVIVGAQGWLADETLRIAQEHAADGVVLWGRAEAHEVPALMRSASVFAFPALYEGFGLPALEAMACGAPIVASKTGPIPEIVGDAGILFDPHSEDEVETALERVLMDQALSSRMRAASLRRASLFTWDRAARAYLDVVRHVCS